MTRGDYVQPWRDDLVRRRRACPWANIEHMATARHLSCAKGVRGADFSRQTAEAASCHADFVPISLCGRHGEDGRGGPAWGGEAGGLDVLPHFGHNIDCGLTFSSQASGRKTFQDPECRIVVCSRRMTRRASREAGIAVMVWPFDGRDNLTEDVVEERATVGVAWTGGRQDVGVWRG